MQKVITVAHQKGGVGKSTIALNLAVELAKKHPLSIIDLDYQKSLTIFNEHRKEKSLPELTILQAEDEKSLMQLINNTEGYILIDSGGFDSDLNRIALIGADLIITPLSNNLIEIYGLEAFKKILQELKEADFSTKAYVLLNNVNPSVTKAIKEMQEYIANNSEFFAMFETILRRRSLYTRSFEEGRSVVEMDPKSKAAQELQSLVQEIETIV